MKADFFRIERKIDTLTALLAGLVRLQSATFARLDDPDGVAYAAMLEDALEILDEAGVYLMGEDDA